MADKPYKTFSQLVDHLITEHNLVVPDKQQAESILKTIPYYDLVNGYKDHFMHNDQYDGSLTIDDLYLYAIYDRSFQSILFKYSIYVETRFRTVMSDVVASHFGENHLDYLKRTKYIKPKDPKRQAKLSDTLKSLRAIYVQTPDHPVPEPTRHYLAKSHIPPWILFKNASFSTLIDLYSFFPPVEKALVAREMTNITLPDNDLISLCQNGLTIIRRYRNTIAHDLKFITPINFKYTLNTKNLSRVQAQCLFNGNEVTTGLGKNDHYSMIIAIILLLNNPVISMQFVRDCIALYVTYDVDTDPKAKWVQTEYLKNMNIPADYYVRMLTYTQTSY